MRRFSAVLICAALLAALFCGCAQESEPTIAPVDPGTVTEPTEPDAQPFAGSVTLCRVADGDLNPLTTKSRINFALAGLIYEGLYALDENFEPVPVLAQSASAEGNVWRITLRGDVLFHDGTPLTAQHVAQTLNAARADATGNYYSRLREVQSVTAQDAETVLITLSRPNSLFLSLLNIPIVKDPVSEPLIGTGAFAYDGGDTSRLLPAAGTQTAVREVILRDVSSDEQVVELFESGEVDFVSMDQDDGGKLVIHGTQNAVSYDSTRLFYLGVNVGKNRALAQPLLRLAVSAAADRSAMIDAIIDKAGSATVSALHPSWYLLDGAVEGYELRSAAELLDEAGFEQSDEAGLRLRDGKPLQLTICVNQKSSEKTSAAKLLARDLKRVGIDAVVNALSESDYLTAVRRGDFDLYVGEIKLLPDMDLSALIGSGGALNYGGFSDVAVDEALAALKAQASPESAQALAALLSEKMPVIPLYFGNDMLLSSGNFASSPTPRPGDPYYGLWAYCK
ncbi:ABC transporter substrate-binding protein [Feifania hominis]|uniref:Solute-binding protein family 5 domain-containing protein n=1 Tax=Feifania hominis TaxID=2763660 RepID=A0A926DDY5_9FIRM|nr:ABC transporter substrate-binding protein [Feifania hominis]MBC8536081.1 hypothetical protein [Feifania hominis]